jgi:inner membrane protein
METQENFFQKFNNWLRESVMVKLGVITFLVLILLIPSSWIQSIMTERQYRVEEVMNEVSQKWSGPQRISGPILMIPYYRTITTKTGTTEIKERVYILPEQLKVKAELKPEVLNRGIFDAVVYHSNIQTQAKFVQPDFKDLNIDESKFVY